MMDTQLPDKASKEESPIKILLVEDNLQFADLMSMRLKHDLGDSSSVEVAPTVAEATEKLREKKYSLILLDLFLIDSKGMDTFTHISEHARNIPILVLTGKDDEQLGINLVRKGAQDYLVKGELDGKVMARFIKHAIERSKVELRLRAAEARFRSIFENSAAAITVSDASERIVSWNRFAEELLGMDHEDLYLKPVHSFYPEEEWKRIRAKNIRETGQRLQMETKIIRKDGKAMDVKISISILRDSEGYLTGAVAIFNDISERKIAERKLQEAEERYRNIFENSAVAITLTDAEERIISWNNFTEGLLGYDKKDLMLKPVWSLYPEEEWKKIRAHNIRQKGMQDHLETVVVKKDGSLLDVDVSLTVLKDEHGKITGAIGIIKDIEARKRAEADLEKARDAAEAANHTKSEFLANMSHEIRTPINGIIGMSEVLGGTALSAEQRSYLDVVKLSANSLLGVINDILDFSKVEAGKLAIELVPFNLRNCAEDVADMVASRARGKKLDVILRIAPDIPERIIGDPIRIGQVLTNFVTNAIKFTKNGHVLVNIEHEQVSNGETRVKFSVQDTGIGIPDDKVDLVFEKFTQADTSTTRKYGGTGLGLAISKQLVELMGGTLGVKSEFGKGSTFWFELKLRVEEDAVETNKEEKESLGGVRIAIVDDNPIACDAMREQVIYFGAQAEIFQSPRNALEEISRARDSSNPFHLALIKNEMSEMSGEAFGVHAADVGGKDFAMIIVSSVNVPEESSRLKGLGFANVLVKPLRRTQLLRAVNVAWCAYQGKGESPDKSVLMGENNVVKKRPSKVEAPKILIVEDNDVNQTVARTMLLRLGCEVDIAVSGIEGIEQFDRKKFDLIFMDCQMPGMDGIECTKVLSKRMEGKRHVPIVAMTAAAMAGDREKCLAAGMDDYISKPVKLKGLQDMLDRWVGVPSTKNQAEQPATKAEKVSVPQDDSELAINEESFSQLLELDQVDPTFLSRLYTMFQNNVSKRFQEIQDAMAEQDSDKLGKAAHSLKGSSGNIGALRMSRFCLKLEEAGKIGHCEEAPMLIDQIKSEYVRVRADLDVRIQHKKSA